MKLEQLIGKTYKKLSATDLSKVGEKLALQVNLTGRQEGVFYIEICGGVLNVMPYEYIDRDAQISLAKTSFEKLLSGKLDITSAVSEGKLSVQGNMQKALLLERLLAA